MGGAPVTCKAYQNNIVHDVGYAISVFSEKLPCCWRYNIGYNIIATYDIVADIVAPRTGQHIGRTDIVPDIVYVKPIFYPISGTDIILMYLAFIRCSSHCSKQ